MRKIQDLKVKVVDSKIQTVRFNMTGGNTGDQAVAYDGKDWNCSCTGFSCGQSCRHIKAGSIIYGELARALDLIATGEATNWK